MASDRAAARKGRFYCRRTAAAAAAVTIAAAVAFTGLIAIFMRVACPSMQLHVVLLPRSVSRLQHKALAGRGRWMQQVQKVFVPGPSLSSFSSSSVLLGPTLSRRHQREVGWCVFQFRQGSIVPTFTSQLLLSSGFPATGLKQKETLFQRPGRDRYGGFHTSEFANAELEEREGNADKMIFEILTKLDKQISHTKGKIKNLKIQLAKSNGSETLLRQADSLMQHKHLYQNGMEKIEVPDWMQMDEDGNVPSVTVQLDPTKGLTENANILYRKYRKAKRARENLEPIMEQSRRHLEKLEDYRERANGLPKGESMETENLFEELLRQNIVNPVENRDDDSKKKSTAINSNAAKTKRKSSGAMKDIDTFKSPSGFTVLAGRSAAANERVTFQLTKRNHVWFHVRGIPGSHVLIRADWDKTKKEDIEFAAKIAAWHSHGKEEKRVEVSYCRGSQLKHPPAKHKKLGAVVISGPEKVVTVEPGLPTSGE